MNKYIYMYMFCEQIQATPIASKLADQSAQITADLDSMNQVETAGMFFIIMYNILYNVEQLMRSIREMRIM